MRGFHVLPIFMVLLGSCNNETEFKPLIGGSDGDGPQIEVSPELLDFGTAGDGEFVSDSFTITNVGVSDLEVKSVEISARDTSFTIMTTPLSFWLPQSASQDIEVVFSPMGAGRLESEAVVSSNDEDTPLVPVVLQAVGQVPDIIIDPTPFDYGQVYIGCATMADIDVINNGPTPVTISELDLTGQNMVLLNPPALPLTLPTNGEKYRLQVEFTPVAETDYQGEIRVISDAPGSPDIGDVLGEGIYAGSTTDRWEIPEDPPVDLIFLVDQSGSMANNAQQLTNQFSNFIGVLGGITSDWRILVANQHDTTQGMELGCNYGGTIQPRDANYVTNFENAIMRGFDYPQEQWTEALLYMASEAVQKTDAGECNENFIRSTAFLHIIMVSDEPDQSPRSWDTYVDMVGRKKGDPSQVRFSAVAGDIPAGCGGTADPGTGYYEAVQATGGQFLSICSDWSRNVETLATASVELSTYELSHQADPSTLVVDVNGIGRNSGWTYDSNSGILTFTDRIPEGGDIVEISYSYLVSCDQ